MTYPSYSLGVGALSHSKNRKLILLVRHHKTPKVWTIPSGYRLSSESIFTTAQRETREETGIKIVPYGLIGIRFRLDNRANIWIIVAAEINQSTLKPDNREIIEARIFSEAEIKELLLTPVTKALIEAWFKQNLRIWEPRKDTEVVPNEFFC